jgi:transcriptional regulator with XRE-family HTH domain
MPRKSSLKLPALDLGKETVGERIARLRKERGYTQIELAERIGAIQALISDYNRDKLRLNGEMAVRFALALEVSTDELLVLAGRKAARGKKPSRKILRRDDRLTSPDSQTAHSATGVEPVAGT